MPDVSSVDSAPGRSLGGRIAYSPAEAAAELGCSRQTIHNLINRGDLRRFKVGRLTKIPAADVHALVGFEGGAHHGAA